MDYLVLLNLWPLLKKRKNKGGIISSEDMPAESRSEDNLHKVFELSNELAERLSEIVFSDGARTYNMSKLASNNMVSVVQNPDGTTRKDVAYTHEDGMSKDITDLLGNTISIKHVGHLGYKCDPSSNDYVSMFSVSKHKDDKVLMNPTILFSNIDMNALDNEDYKSIVANTLLSNNNIELSQADGYIGEIYSQSTLHAGEEKFTPGFYTYQIPGTSSKKYALVYEGAKIEAVRAYKQELEKSIKEKEAEDEER